MAKRARIMNNAEKFAAGVNFGCGEKAVATGYAAYLVQRMREDAAKVKTPLSPVRDLRYGRPAKRQEQPRKEETVGTYCDRCDEPTVWLEPVVPGYYLCHECVKVFRGAVAKARMLNVFHRGS